MLACGIAAAAPGPLGAQEMVESDTLKTWTLDASYEDARFGLKLAIESHGFVVDHVSHVGEMLNRTAADVGATRQVYAQAEVLQFCSATLSREMMEADPANIAFCPYGLFLYQAEGSEQVVLGFRRMPEGAMQKVETLLTEIAEEAAGF